MRLFAAVLPPAHPLGQLAAEVGRLKQLPDAERLRWTGHDGWHFTLAFYGEVPADVLDELHERLGRRAGLRMGEHRPYTPHLTLARNRSGRLDLVPYTAALADFASGVWRVEEIALMRSHPPAPGVPGSQPHYEPVARWPLGG